MSHNVSEQTLRSDLAAAYHLLELNGWEDQIFTHISVRLPTETPSFLINPYGLRPAEVRASGLVAIDVNGHKLCERDLDVNPAGFVVHSAVHMKRHDAVCVMHCHTLAGMAIAAQAGGLLPVNQTNMAFYNRVAYCDYGGIPLESDMRADLAASLGDKHSAIMRNHGLLTIGRSVAEAYFRMFYLNKACEIQLAAQSSGNTLIIPAANVCEFTASQFEQEQYHTESVELVWASELRRLDRLNPAWRD